MSVGFLVFVDVCFDCSMAVSDCSMCVLLYLGVSMCSVVVDYSFLCEFRCVFHL